MTKRLELPMEDSLRYHVEFEQLITSISTHFINLSLDQIDAGVLHALQSVGEFAGIDRSSVFLFNGNGIHVDNTHEWCAPGVEAQSSKLQNLSPENFPWWAEKLKAREIVHTPKVSTMPPEARAEHDLLCAQGVRSALLVPMVRQNELIGFLGFGSVRSEKSWPEETLGLLKVVGEIVASALARKHTEMELRASERKYRSLFENAFDGVYQSTPEGKILTVNPALVRLLGFESEEELLKADINSLYVDPEERKRNIARLEKQGELRNAELHLKRNDGEPVIFLENTFAVRDEKGAIIYYEGTLTDITQRKIAEDALRESITFIEELITDAGEGIVGYDRDLRYLVWNPYMEKLTGLPADEVLGKRAPDLFPHLREQGVLDLLQRALEGERTPSQDVHYYIPQTGKSGWVVGTYCPHRNARGEVIGVIGVITDISERKKAEEALRQSETRYRLAARASSDAIYDWDIAANKIDWNEGVQIFGYRLNEVQSQSKWWNRHIHPDDLDKVLADMRKAMENQSARWSFEYRYSRADGTYAMVQERGFFIYDQAGKPIRMVGAMTDITDRRQAQLLETALYRIAEESNSAEDMQQLYAAIHRIIAELMYAKNFYIALYDEETETLTFPYFVDEVDSPPSAQKLGKGLTEYLIQTGQPLLVNPEKMEQLVQAEKIAPKGSAAIDWLGVPLKHGDKTFGVLAVQSHSENVRYGSKEKEILTFVSQHIAGVLERKKAQDVLRVREERLRFLVEQMPAIFWSTDANLRITASMGAGLARVKMKPDETVGLYLADVLRGEPVAPVAMDAHTKALEGQSVTYEYEFRNRDFRVHVEPWRNQNGTVIGTLGLAFDVTEPKKAEEKLERSLSLLRATLESTADGILVVDQEGKWISFNKKFVEMWRIPEAIVDSRDEALMLAYVLDQVKNPGEFVAKLKELYTGFQEESFDVVEFKDGRLFERYSQPQVIGGRSVGRVWSFRNVTERKRAEALRSALYRIAAQTSIAEDMQEFYAAIHKIVGELMYAKNFYIALYDKTNHILSFPYFVDELDTPPPPMTPAKGLTEYVLSHGDPLLALPEKFKELVESGDVESVGAPSLDWLGVPLKSTDRTFGVLVVQSYTEEVRFGEREKEVLTFVSQHIASALERKRAQESLSESAEQLEKSLSIVRATLESTADGILVVDTSGRITIFNQRFLDMWRIPEDVMASRDDTRAIQFVLEQLEDPGGFLTKVQELYTNPDAESYDVLKFKDGRIFERYSIPQRIGNKTVGRVWSFSDVTEHRHAELALRESAERYALAALGANDGLWDWNLKTNEVYYSARWRAMVGCAEEEIGNSPDEWLNRVHPDDIARVQSEIEAHLQGLTPHFENEHRMLHKDGSYRWMLTRGIAVPDGQGKASRMAGSQTDVTDRKNAEERLMHEAIHDVLTGLANRALFMDLLARAIGRARRRSDYVFAVLFLDLDRFKIINDSLGHMIGDQLLVEIARRIESCVRPGDTVARLGGDEFTILVEDITDVTDATHVAERIQHVLRKPFNIGGQEIFTSASVGIAMSAPNYDRPEEILRDADTAMYRAKTLGKARHQVFDTGMHARAVALLHLETDLRRALERHEFRVHYQPTVSLKTGKLIGFEALLRWQHPERGLVLPAEFIPNAEETGLIIPIGQWVLREACNQMRQWQRDSQIDLTISVNLSGRQFNQHDLVQQINDVLEETELNPNHLILEITESMLMENPESARAMLAELKMLNVDLHIDDFGTGYSSLSYLHHFPIDSLKIDRSFVSRMGSDLEIIKSIVNLAHNLRMRVIAEGVETPQQYDQLRAMHCEAAQGFLFSRPVDHKRAQVLLAARPTW